jgi:hypothetical protein
VPRIVIAARGDVMVFIGLTDGLGARRPAVCARQADLVKPPARGILQHHMAQEEENPAMTDLPICLKRAREEVLLALGAESAEDERRHRARADRLTAEAVRSIQHAPERSHDWSLLVV